MQRKSKCFHLFVHENEIGNQSKAFNRQNSSGGDASDAVEFFQHAFAHVEHAQLRFLSSTDMSAKHVEEHFSGSDVVRDVVIGMADGLTVPFALAAGISGALASTHIVVTAGVAEIAAGAIAMGLGGFLAAKSDEEHFFSELGREEDEIKYKAEAERQEITAIFQEYGISEEESKPVLTALEKNPAAWRDFMMRFELGLEKPDPKRAIRSAITIAGSYIVGGLIPLAPYILMSSPHKSLAVSAIVTLMALGIFGFIKGHFTEVPKVKSSVQTMLVGGLAAGVAYAIAKLVG